MSVCSKDYTAQQIFTSFPGPEPSVLYRIWHAVFSGAVRIFVSRKVFEENGITDLNIKLMFL